ncbi:MAG: helix-turn-helix domain-containing protein [Burkholderiales bacterium]|jgi:AraC-like DNA-binding protein|nr:helix-turn-helix domain-containing protein [Burkholderiales bacterium]
MKTDSPYVRWTHEAGTDAYVTVLPDGCRDVLVIERAGVTQTLLLTDWDASPRRVQIPAGTTITGYRLRPGYVVEPQCIVSHTFSEAQVAQWIESEARASDEIAWVIDALATPFATIDNIAKQTGVTTRTLQRHFSARGLPAPDFWRLLGRARRAACALPTPLPITEIAYAHGYSDQAHMSREFARWFGAAPVALRRDANRLADVCQPGLGNWIGEQISIK